MSSELTKAQDNAKRFQDILSVERRKQKALQVHIDTITSLLHHILYIHSTQ